MERCAVQYRPATRRSFEKPRVEAHPRLQVIGFNVSPKSAEATATESALETVSSCSGRAPYNDQVTPSLPKPADSSPRSALQQLLLHQSLPSTSPTSSDQSLAQYLPLQPATSPPATATTKMASHGLLQPSTEKMSHELLLPSAAPSTNQKWTTGISTTLESPPSAHQTNLGSGRLKSLLPLESCTSSVAPANQSFCNTFFSSFNQSQYASSSSSSSSGSQRITRQNDSKPSKVVIKENYFQIKQTRNGRNDAKAHEMKGGQLITAKVIRVNEVINDLPCVAKSTTKKSSWLHDDDEQPASVADQKCERTSWIQGLHPINDEHPVGHEKGRKSIWSEENSKKSSLFMFVVSSPAAEFHLHLHHHSAEHNASSRSMDFLSSCHLCRRLLGQGQDVFMYSGDKAFCSMECRYQQIVIDERKERCPPSIIRSGASPAYQHTSVNTASTHHPNMISKPHFINTAAAA